MGYTAIGTWTPVLADASGVDYTLQTHDGTFGHVVLAASLAASDASMTGRHANDFPASVVGVCALVRPDAVLDHLSGCMT